MRYPFSYLISLILGRQPAAVGALSLLLFLLQSAIAIFVFARVDYIEHYGLARERLSDGKFERLGEAHSWNSSYLLTNVASAMPAAMPTITCHRPSPIIACFIGMMRRNWPRAMPR